MARPRPRPLAGGGDALLGGQSGRDPVLDAIGVLANVGVAELLELGGDVAAVGAGAVGAAGDDGGVLVGQRGGVGVGVGVGVDVDEVERAGQVLLGVVGLRQRVDEDQGAGVQRSTVRSTAGTGMATLIADREPRT